MQVPEILPGLPGEGPMPEQFTWSGRRTHSEGLVVRFFPSNGEFWIGNFQRGSSSFSTVLNGLDPRQYLIVAGGELYIVDIETRALLHGGGGEVEFISHVPDTQSIVLGNGLWFESLGPCSWKTRRISWDGMRDIRITGVKLNGSAWTPLDEQASWVDFEVDLVDGSARGGSYNGPDAG